MIALAGKAFTALGWVAGWAGAVKGASVLGGVGRALAEKYPQIGPVAPVISGAGDTIANILDPADIFGHRKAKEDDLRRKAGIANARAGKAEKDLKNARQDMRAQREKDKRVETQSRKLRNRISKADNASRDFSRRAATAESRGKRDEAERWRKKAISSSRWARAAATAAEQATEQMAQMQDQPGAVDQTLAIMQAGIEMAKNAANPPMSAIEAVDMQSSDAGKQTIIQLVDSVNRVQEPDYGAMISELVDSGVSFGDDDDGGTLEDYLFGPEPNPEAAEVTSGKEAETVLAGPCCFSCSYGGSCKPDKHGHEKSVVGSSFIDGSIIGLDGLDDANEDDDFWEMLVGGPEGYQSERDDKKSSFSRLLSGSGPEGYGLAEDEVEADYDGGSFVFLAKDEP